LVTIGSGVSEGAGVEFPTFPLTCVVVLKTLWHYRASVWLRQRRFNLSSMTVNNNSLSYRTATNDKV